MNAGDTSTLRQVSLAAIIGLDATILLSTDDPATHTVYDRVIEQAAKWADVRATNIARETAYEVVRGIAAALTRKKGAD